MPEIPTITVSRPVDVAKDYAHTAVDVVQSAAFNTVLAAQTKASTIIGSPAFGRFNVAAAQAKIDAASNASIKAIDTAQDAAHHGVDLLGGVAKQSGWAANNAIRGANAITAQNSVSAGSDFFALAGRQVARAKQDLLHSVGH